MTLKGWQALIGACTLIALMLTVGSALLAYSNRIAVLENDRDTFKSEMQAMQQSVERIDRHVQRIAGKLGVDGDK